MGIRRIMERENSQDKMAAAKYGYDADQRWVQQNEDEVKIPAIKRCLGIRSGRRGYGNNQCSSKATQKNHGILCKKCMDDAQSSVHSIVNKSIDAILEIDPHADAQEVEAWILKDDQTYDDWKGTAVSIYFGYGENTEVGKYCLKNNLITYTEYVSPTFITDAVEKRQGQYEDEMSGWFEVIDPIGIQNNGECHGRYGDMQDPNQSKRMIEANLSFMAGKKTPVGVWSYNNQSVGLYVNYTHATHVQVDADGNVHWFVKGRNGYDDEYDLFPSAEDIKEHDRRQNHNKAGYAAVMVMKATNLVKLIHAHCDGNDDLELRLNRQLSVVEDVLEWQEQRRATNQQMYQAWLDADVLPVVVLPSLFGGEEE